MPAEFGHARNYLDGPYVVESTR